MCRNLFSSSILTQQCDPVCLMKIGWLSTSLFPIRGLDWLSQIEHPDSHSRKSISNIIQLYACCKQKARPGFTTAIEYDWLLVAMTFQYAFYLITKAFLHSRHNDSFAAAMNWRIFKASLIKPSGPHTPLETSTTAGMDRPTACNHPASIRMSC